jgi:hypothetical protein
VSDRIEVEAVTSGEGLRIVLDPSAGEPRRISTIFVQARSGDLVWWLVPRGSEDQWEVARSSLTVLGPPDSVDPAELALLEEAAAEVPAESVKELVYGTVPAGFVQALPRRGEAPQLTPGEEYAVAVFGPKCHGGVSFVA